MNRETPVGGQSPSDLASSTPRAIATGILLIVILSFAVFRVLTPGDQRPAAGDDIRAYYYPAYLTTYQQVADGHLPLWNPYQLCGLPQIGVIQIGVLYPLHIVYVFLSTSNGMLVSALLHLAIVAISAIAFARKAGMVWLSGLLAGLLLTTRGQFISMLHFPNMMEAATWAVPGCVAILYLVEGRFAKPIAALSACVAMSVLAGYPQSTVLLGYLWGSLLCGLLIVGLRPPRIWLGALGGLAAAVALGTLISSVQLLPSLELSEHGNRKITSLTLKEIFPLGRNTGAMRVVLSRLYDSGEANSRATYYFGMVGLCLLPVGILKRGRGRNLVLIGIGLFVLFASLGPVTPVFFYAYMLPMMASFRLPARMRFVVDICFALAAAGGLHAVMRILMRESGADTDWRGRLASGWPALAAVLAAIFLTTRLVASRPASAAFASATGVLVLAGLFFARRPAQIAWLGIIVIGLAALELFAVPARSLRFAFMKPEQVAVYDAPDPTFDLLRKSPERVWIHSPGFDPKYPVKVASAQRIRGIIDYEPATTRRQAEYFGYLNRGTPLAEEKKVPYFGALKLLGPNSDPDALLKRNRLLELTSLRYILTTVDPTSSPQLAQYLRRKRFEIVRRDDDHTLWRSPEAVPRAYVVYDVREAPDTRELLRRISNRRYDPLKVTYVEDPPDDLPQADAPRPRGTAATIESDQPNEVVIRARLEADGMVVLSDTWFPGWRAWVDGTEVEIHPVNHLFRGVQADAGEHVIVFAYRPQSVALGAAGSTLGLAICCVLAVAPWRRRAAGDGR